MVANRARAPLIRFHFALQFMAFFLQLAAGFIGAFLDLTARLVQIVLEFRTRGVQLLFGPAIILAGATGQKRQKNAGRKQAFVHAYGTL